MRYLFQNVHKSRKTVHDLLDSRRNAIDIIFIQEAPINFIRKVPSASNPEGDDLVGPVIHKAWICVDRRLASPDSTVAIYINKCLSNSYQLFPLEGHDFTIVNIYNRPVRRNAAVELLLKVVHTLSNLAVVQGDFNLHSPLWDSSVQKGSETALALHIALSEAGMNLMNDEDEPTWSNGRGSTSIIDLLFVSNRLCALEPLIETSLDNRGRSDHALITCLFGSQLPRPGKAFIAKDSEEEDEFCLFLGTILVAIPTIGDDLDTEDMGKGLSQLLTDKWASLAKTPITSRPHGSSWWNEECQTYRDAYNLVRSKENLKAYNAVTRRA
ncbi:hypothetical protein AX14_000508 [Amanita brunnescens Koide BX004]|nr:hypothetical protein AX14_000508 [Amanita brunnescens Koide BX004]